MFESICCSVSVLIKITIPGSKYNKSAEKGDVLTNVMTYFRCYDLPNILVPSHSCRPAVKTYCAFMSQKSVLYFNWCLVCTFHIDPDNPELPLEPFEIHQVFSIALTNSFAPLPGSLPSSFKTKGTKGYYIYNINIYIYIFGDALKDLLWFCYFVL